MLLLGPHPDDFDAVGVTLNLVRENNHSLFAGVSRTGGGVEDSFCLPCSLERKNRLREEEQRRSIRFFGLSESNLTFLDLEQDAEDELRDCVENTARLNDFINILAPDIVLLPHGNDTNAGHVHMYAMFSRIAKDFGAEITALLIRDPKTLDMREDVTTPFGKDEAQWKGELLRFHESQQSRNLNTRGYGFDQRILDLNRQIARRLCLPAQYAEAFQAECFP